MSAKEKIVEQITQENSVKTNIQDSKPCETETLKANAFCKKCGGELDNHKKCTNCGKQYGFRKLFSKSSLLLIILSGLLLGSIIFNVYQMLLINEHGNIIDEQTGIISELETQKNKDSQEIGRLNKIVSEQSITIENNKSKYDIDEMEMNWYRTNVAFIYNIDTQFYHTAYCAKIDSEIIKGNDAKKTMLTRSEAWDLGYRPCSSCH